MGFIILIIIGAIAGCGYLCYVLYQIAAEDTKIKRREWEYEKAVKHLKRNGYKTTYTNKNTGTISFKDEFGNSHSVSLYKGYNSHCDNPVEFTSYKYLKPNRKNKKVKKHKVYDSVDNDVIDKWYEDKMYGKIPDNNDYV